MAENRQKVRLVVHYSRNNQNKTTNLLEIEIISFAWKHNDVKTNLLSCNFRLNELEVAKLRIFGKFELQYG